MGCKVKGLRFWPHKCRTPGYTSSGIIALQEKDQAIPEETEGEMPAEGENRPGSEEKAEQEKSTGKVQVLERSEK